MKIAEREREIEKVIYEHDLNNSFPSLFLSLSPSLPLSFSLSLSLIFSNLPSLTLFSGSQW